VANNWEFSQEGQYWPQRPPPARCGQFRIVLEATTFSRLKCLTCAQGNNLVDDQLRYGNKVPGVEIFPIQSDKGQSAVKQCKSFASKKAAVPVSNVGLSLVSD